jgi:predicted nucleic acid-binding protein
MTDAIEIMKDIDPKDAPFLAVGMAIRADGIWTEDRHFESQNVLRVFTTKDLIPQIWDD